MYTILGLHLIVHLTNLHISTSPVCHNKIMGMCIDCSALYFNVMTVVYQFIDTMIIVLCRGDCGVYVLKFVEYLMAGLPLDFSHKDIPFFRRKYAEEVYARQLSV